ncbi:MAG TPA: aryl-sulfate sulfotransferase [Candidatus Didemnitutus sp.]|nr:aryl-sulfate sulfotransferase [Candidatus Didemnitutus sp.]
MFRHLLLTISVLVVALGFAFVPSIQAQQKAFRNFDIEVKGQPAPGYYIIGEVSTDSFAVMDHAGKYMYKAGIGDHANIQTYGGKWITYFITNNGKQAFVRLDKNMNVIDTMRSSADYDTDFHEARIITDTSYYILGQEILQIDMSQVVSGGRPDAYVIANVIEERSFSGNTLFSWRSIEHIPVTDAAPSIDLTAAGIDYMHVNSITMARDGNIIISARHLSEVIKINRQTGAIMWRLGGSDSKNNQFQFLNDTTDGYFGFSSQHSAFETADGTILLFDNGNTKPTVRSRAVEYAIDLNAMTARKVFEFSPDPPAYASSMGSVQELENGNILIGYGSGSNRTVAQEVTRDGAIQIQITNNATIGFAAYRVIKSELFMTGVFKRFSTSGTIPFSKGDSSTHVTATITRVDEATSAVVERHSYSPHAIDFASDAGCGVIPARWVVRFKKPAKVDGSLDFELDEIPSIEFPEKIKLFRRAIEGSGDFTLVNATYSASTGRLTVSGITNGEYMLAYPECFAPTLTSPLHASVEVDTLPKFTWTTAVGGGEYQAEFSTDEGFVNVPTRFTTRRLDTTLTIKARGTTFFWRVRAKTTSGYGPWSTISRFTTKLPAPQIISPKIDKDTVAVLRSAEFSWIQSPGADGYRVRIERTDVSETIIDTIVIGQKFVPGSRLLPNTKYSWIVTSIKGNVTSASSVRETFITALPAPQLQKPAAEATNVATVNVTFQWTPVPSALKYILTIVNATDGTTVIRDSVIQGSLVVATLPAASRFEWTCYAMGRYGRGEHATPMFFTTAASLNLSQPFLLGPKSTGNVDTSNVLFTWSPVANAQVYDLQVSSSGSFTTPDTSLIGLTDTRWTAPRLKSGSVYEWRVIARAENAISPWSRTATFTTAAASSGGGLTPLVPLAGSVNVPVSGVFMYTTSENYTSYTVLVDTIGTFDGPLLSISSDNGTAAYSGLAASTQYFWKVVGRTKSGSDEEGPSARFETVGITSGLAETSELLSTVTLVGNRIFIRDGEELPDVQSVNIYNVQGRLLQSIHWPTGSDNAHIETQLNPGVYIVHVHGTDASDPVKAYTVFQPYR